MKWWVFLCLLAAAAGTRAQTRQISLAQMTYAALQARYDALVVADQACRDLACAVSVGAAMELVGQELTRRDLAQLRADDALFEPLAAELNSASIALDAMARKKWCHTSLWRWLGRYREPRWCDQGGRN